MRRKRNPWRLGLVSTGVVLTLAAGLLVFIPSVSTFVGSAFRSRPSREHMVTSAARLADLTVSMHAGGRVNSSDNTIIDCRLENIEFRVRGMGVNVGGSSTILSVAPEGSSVKEGDVLCEIDSSSYVELVRQQQMTLERVKAEHLQASLNLDVARLSVAEFRDGFMAEDIRSMRGKIALAQAGVERAEDRLGWTKRMLDKGYVSLGQMLNEEVNLKRLTISLKQNRGSLGLYEKYSAPMQMMVLESKVRSAEMNLTFQDRRLERTKERLEYYQKQVNNCTIRAPHDGFLIYVNDEMKQTRIEPGMVVRLRQKLFYLPDLKRMEVAAMLHESVVKDVKAGMRVKVRVEGLPDRTIEGYVESVTQIPTQNFFNDVKYFVGIVKLDNVPRGLMPGMSAEVDIMTTQVPHALVVPVEALTVEKGQDVMYVAHEDSVERREVTIGQATRELIEVTSGLDLGDEVVIDPTSSPVMEAVLAGSTTTEPAETTPAEQVDAPVSE